MQEQTQRWVIQQSQGMWKHLKLSPGFENFCKLTERPGEIFSFTFHSLPLL